VALATICDIVPLKGVNRTFVKQGLKVLAQRQNTGLRALMDIARLDRRPTPHTLGFLLGPRLNAGGRLGQSDLGLQLLSSADDDLANAIAQQLDELNMQRRITEKEVQQQAEEMALAKLAKNPGLTVLVLASEGWHEGVIGIVAGRIKDRFNRPSIVISLDEAGTGKGSGRSVKGFSLGDAIMAARQQDILVSGGGHDMAAGLGLEVHKQPELEAFMLARANSIFAEPPRKTFLAAHNVSVAGLDFAFSEWLEKIGPFGSGFAEPRFYITHCRLTRHHWMGAEKQHLSVSLDDGTAPALRAVAFNLAGTDLGKAIQDNPDPGPVMVLGTLRADTYRGGKNVQFMIEDIALNP
jgi:single-stranded-DNA-specific exonuclease